MLDDADKSKKCAAPVFDPHTLGEMGKRQFEAVVESNRTLGLWFPDRRSGGVRSRSRRHRVGGGGRHAPAWEPKGATYTAAPRRRLRAGAPPRATTKFIAGEAAPVGRMGHQHQRQARLAARRPAKLGAPMRKGDRVCPWAACCRSEP
jgi:hypothetical protein